MSISFSLSERFLHPEGTFPAQLVAIEPASGKYGAMIKWLFTTDQAKEDGEAAQLAYWTGTKFGPKAKINAFLAGLRVMAPVTDEEAAAFDPEALIGRVCRVRVVHAVGPDGQTWGNIDAILPPAPRSPRPAASPPTPAPVPDEFFDPFDTEEDGATDVKLFPNTPVKALPPAQTRGL